MAVTDPVAIESLILANHVEAVNGLLYISGAGWDSLSRAITPGNPAPMTHFGVAVILSVPWHETNRMHTLTLEIRDEDANTVVMSVGAQFTVGRPPQLRPGARQYPNLGLHVDTVFPSAGAYEVVARVNGMKESERRWTFTVQDVTQMAATA